MYVPIAPLELEAWMSPEPMPYEAREEGDHVKLGIGDAWGEKLFDCAWFHFTGSVPSGYENQPLVIRVDLNGELCLFDERGQPIRGLTAAACSVPGINLGAPLKSVFEIPSEMRQSGTISLWGDAGLNGLFGELPDTGRILMAEIATVDEDARALYYDLEVIASYLTTVDDETNPRYRKYRSVFKAACALAPSARAKARAICATILKEEGGDSLLTVTAVGHSHLDLAWLWPIRETIRKAARTFSTALYNIERYPDYVFGASQPQQFAWMKALYPELYERIKVAVSAGRIEVQGCMWVEADMNISGGEALVRQIIHGCRYFREEFGVEMDYLWLPDVFGYNAQLPQILQKAGMKWFMTQKLSWNLVNTFPYHSFHWRGIDGSSVLAHTPPENTYNSHATLLSLSKIQNEYKQLEVSGHALMLYGIGDGGGGPGAEHLERLKREKNLPGMPRVKSRGAAGFFEDWSKEADRFPEWNGELYLECHQGTFTTQALTKKNNRRCETLLRELEWCGLLAEGLNGPSYPALDKIWQEVLLYQFHDILPGSSIQRVYDEANARYAELIDELEDGIRERYQALANAVARNPGEAVVFNSLPWERSEWIQHAGAWRRITVPGMGRAVLGAADEAASFTVQGEERQLENEWVRVRFADDGTVSSIYNKKSEREMVLPSESANRFAVYADYGHAWDAPLDYRAAPPLRAELIHRSFESEGPRVICTQEFKVGQSVIKQRVVITDGSPLVEFDTELDWRDHQTMLRVEFPIDARSAAARYEIQFGEVERPTHSNTTWDAAKDEVPHHQWMDFAQADRGVTILNDCKYGARVKDQVMELTLLRCVPTPQGVGALIPKRSDPERKEIYGDLGRHHFRYAIHAHDGGANPVPLARQFNVPLTVFTADAPDQPRDTPNQWLEISDARIDLPAVKKAEDGRGVIVRMVMTEAAKADVVLRSELPFSEAEEVDLQERPLARIPVEADSIRVEMGPYEIKTIRLA